jgi:twitching motility protein PilU
MDGEVRPQMDRALNSEQSALLVRSIMNDRQTKEFDATKECNFAIAPPGIGRFRVSAFVQQGCTGCVIRLINAKIPSFEELDLPVILRDVVLSKRGLVIVVGGTGSGKSTTLAAMVGYRNEKTRGHIVTIEDPVEYVHPHRGCVITQREVGVDTDSWHAALKNTLRQAPDVILIGEIRDRETMASSSPRPGTWCWPRCTPTAPTRRWTASSISSARSGASSCSWTCRSTSAR